MKKTFINVSIILLWVSSASALTIGMSSGRVIEGNVVEKTDEYIKVQTKEQLWKIRIKDLDEKTKDIAKNLSVEQPSQPSLASSTADIKNNSATSKYESYIQLGEEQFKLHNYDQAIESFRKAVEVNPQADYAYQMLANCSANLKRYPDSLSYAKKALGLNPKNAQVHTDLGYYYQALKQYKESIEEFKVAIQLLPKSHSLYMAYRGLGDSYMFIRELEQALEVYKKAVDIHPDFGLLTKIAEGLSVSGKYQEAVNYIERAQRIEPENPFLFTIKGGLLTYLEQFKEAQENFQNALEIFKKQGNNEGINKIKEALMALEQAQKNKR